MRQSAPMSSIDSLFLYSRIASFIFIAYLEEQPRLHTGNKTVIYKIYRHSMHRYPIFTRFRNWFNINYHSEDLMAVRFRFPKNTYHGITFENIRETVATLNHKLPMQKAAIYVIYVDLTFRTIIVNQANAKDVSVVSSKHIETYILSQKSFQINFLWNDCILILQWFYNSQLLSIGLCDGLSLIRRQVFAWTNYEPVRWHIYASYGHNGIRLGTIEI